MLCSCVVGRWTQYGGHHESDLGGCRAVVQRSWYDSSPVKCLKVSLVRVWPRRLVKEMFSLNCLAIRKVLLISGHLPSRTKLRDRVSDRDVVSLSLLQCAFCGHYRHISCILRRPSYPQSLARSSSKINSLFGLSLSTLDTSWPFTQNLFSDLHIRPPISQKQW